MSSRGALAYLTAAARALVWRAFQTSAVIPAAKDTNNSRDFLIGGPSSPEPALYRSEAEEVKHSNE